jgi:hypothetical protein
VQHTKENQTEQVVPKIAHGRVPIFVSWLPPIKDEGHEIGSEQNRSHAEDARTSPEGERAARIRQRRSHPGNRNNGEGASSRSHLGALTRPRAHPDDEQEKSSGRRSNGGEAILPYRWEPRLKHASSSSLSLTGRMLEGGSCMEQHEHRCGARRRAACWPARCSRRRGPLPLWTCQRPGSTCQCTKEDTSGPRPSSSQEARSSDKGAGLARWPRARLNPTMYLGSAVYLISARFSSELGKEEMAGRRCRVVMN